MMSCRAEWAGPISRPEGAECNIAKHHERGEYPIGLLAPNNGQRAPRRHRDRCNSSRPFGQQRHKPRDRIAALRRRRGHVGKARHKGAKTLSRRSICHRAKLRGFKPRIEIKPRQHRQDGHRFALGICANRSPQKRIKGGVLAKRNMGLCHREILAARAERVQIAAKARVLGRDRCAFQVSVTTSLAPNQRGHADTDQHRSAAIRSLAGLWPGSDRANQSASREMVAPVPSSMISAVIASWRTRRNVA